MYNTCFDINILVNGNRCKFYHHQGKTFIEAKHGTEYELEIKNNTLGRLLCLASVDGLSVLNGQTATDDDAGYVIPSYSPLRIKGFRYSNDEVAAFKFTDKHGSYAHSQGGCEAAKNCGVIGFKLYNETVKLPPITWSVQWNNSGTPCEGLYGPGRYGYSTTDGNLDIPYGGTNTSTNTIKGCATYNKSEPACGCSIQNSSLDVKSEKPLRSFDMGSTWGQKVQSKVIETDFERGNLTFSLDIYYASRQSLIDMGIPINLGHQVSFPQSFPNKYATPPSGWRG